MRILVVADIHETPVKLPKDVDAVFIAGDFTNASSADFAKKFLDSVEVDKIYAVPGNMDTKDVLNLLEERGISVHRKVIDFEGYKLMGFGGSSITPFNTPMEFDDERIEEEIAGMEADIALFHDVPNGFFDWIAGKNVGSMAIRKWIESKKPKLVFCAHIHEYKGVAKLGDTLIVKVPPASKGEGVMVEFKDLKEPIIQFIQLEK